MGHLLGCGVDAMILVVANPAESLMDDAVVQLTAFLRGRARPTALVCSLSRKT